MVLESAASFNKYPGRLGDLGGLLRFQRVCRDISAGHINFGQYVGFSAELNRRGESVDANNSGTAKNHRNKPLDANDLAKSRSAKTRQVKDDQKPTGKLYTVRDVVAYLSRRTD